MKRCVQKRTRAHTQSRHSWVLANKNRPCVCVVSLQWNISLQDQVEFDPAPWARDSHGSTKDTASCKQRTRNSTMNADSRHGYTHMLVLSHASTRACTQSCKKIITLFLNVRSGWVSYKCRYRKNPGWGEKRCQRR